MQRYPSSSPIEQHHNPSASAGDLRATSHAPNATASAVAETPALVATTATQQDQAVKELVIELRNRAAQLSLRVDQIVLTAVTSPLSTRPELLPSADPSATSSVHTSTQDDIANAHWPNVIIYGPVPPSISFPPSHVHNSHQNNPLTSYYSPAQPPSKRARDILSSEPSSTNPSTQLDAAVFHYPPAHHILSMPHLYSGGQPQHPAHIVPSQSQMQFHPPSQAHGYIPTLPGAAHPPHAFYHAQYYHHPHDPTAAAAAAAAAAHHRDNMFWSTVLGTGAGRGTAPGATSHDAHASQSIHPRPFTATQMTTSQLIQDPVPSTTEQGASSERVTKAEYNPASGATSAAPKTGAFACDLCPSTFGQRSNLTKHVKTVHQGLRPFECTQCLATFGHKNLLQEHISTQHLGERPFTCDVCGASFGRKSNLYQHSILVHQQRRCFECDICKVSFGLKGNLNKHIRVVHNKERPFQCDVCGASFGLKSDLKRHRSSVHSSATHQMQSDPMQSTVSASMGSTTSEQRSDGPSPSVPPDSVEMQESRPAPSANGVDDGEWKDSSMNRTQISNEQSEKIRHGPIP